MFLVFSKAQLYGLKMNQVPVLHSQISKYNKFLDENERNKLKRVFANIHLENNEPSEEVTYTSFADNSTLGI